MPKLVSLIPFICALLGIFSLFVGLYLVDTHHLPHDYAFMVPVLCAVLGLGALLINESKEDY